MLELVALPATPPSSLVRAGPTPSPKAKTQLLWTTRKPRCSDYGVARHYAFKRWGHYFCNPCDLWDALPPDTTQKSSIHSSRYECTAEHTHFSYPTTLRRDDCCYFRQRKRTIGIVAPPGCFSVEVQRNSSVDDEQEVSSESDSCVSSSFKEQNDTSRSSVLLLTEDNQSKSTTYTATTTTDTATSDESSQTAALKAWIKVLEGKVALLRQQNKLLCKEVQKINGPKLSSVRDG